MNEPRIPLKDDPSVPASVRVALSSASRHAAPFDAATGLARLETAVAAAPVAGGVSGLVGVVLAVIGVAGGLAVWMTTRTDSVETADSTETVAAASPRLDELGEPLGVPSPPALPSVTPELVEPPPGEHVAAAPTVAATRPRTPPRAGAEPSDEDVAAIEYRLVGEVRALVANDPAAALARLDRLDDEVPDGFLGREREGLRVLALSGVGRNAEAHRLGDRFLAAHPDGALADRVRRALGIETRSE